MIRGLLSSVYIVIFFILLLFAIYILGHILKLKSLIIQITNDSLTPDIITAHLFSQNDRVLELL